MKIKSKYLLFCEHWASMKFWKSFSNKNNSIISFVGAYEFSIVIIYPPACSSFCWALSMPTLIHKMNEFFAHISIRCLPQYLISIIKMKDSFSRNIPALPFSLQCHVPFVKVSHPFTITIRKFRNIFYWSNIKSFHALPLICPFCFFFLFELIVPFFF